jgi:hypothetical protein
MYKTLFKQNKNVLIGLVTAMVLFGSLAAFRYFIEKQSTHSSLDMNMLNQLVEEEINGSPTMYHFVFIGGCEHQLYVNGIEAEQLTDSQRRDVLNYLTSKINSNFTKGNIDLHDVVSFFPYSSYEADDKKPTDCGKIWYKTTWDL